jgi:UDP-glucose-4-epimerase GalE
MKNSKNIIVTGGAGYIGANICKALYLSGYNPTTLDNLSSGYKNFVKWGPLEIGDISNKTWLLEQLKKYSPVAVIHCAGLICVEYSFKDPQNYFHNNVIATQTLLQAMQQAGCGKIIFSSSASVYGSTNSKTISEDHPCNPENPYAENKLAAEHAIVNSGLEYIILRYFNAAGADEAFEVGELHTPETHLIPLAISAAINNGVFKLNGDGSIVRDFIHVTDIAAAHIMAFENYQQSQIINIGSGVGYSVAEVLQTIEKVAGKKINIQHQPKRQGDVPHLVANITKAQKILGFNPQKSSLSNIIRTAFDFSNSVKSV